MEDMRTMPPTMMPMAPGPRTSGLAIASLVLGLLAFVTCGATSLVGLILGIVALSVIGSSAEPLQGRGMAIWGIVLSTLGMILPIVLILAAILTPALSRARGQAQRMLAMNEARQLALAMVMYADDNNGQYPDPQRWQDRIANHMGPQPSAGEIPVAWAMNAGLEEIRAEHIKNPTLTVLIVAVEPGSPTCGGQELLDAAWLGGTGRYIVAFADGHVQAMHEIELDRLIWEIDAVPGSGSGSMEE